MVSSVCLGCEAGAPDFEIMRYNNTYHSAADRKRVNVHDSQILRRRITCPAGLHGRC